MPNKDLSVTGRPVNGTRVNSKGTTPQASTRPSRSTSSAPKERIRVPDRDASSNCSSPTNSEPTKKIPPIKAPVGLAKPPDLKNVSSKIGSLANVKHKPAGGEKKPLTQKLDWSSGAKSKIGSLENKSHKAGGGEVKVVHQKLEWKVTSKVGSLDNVKHKPGGGQIQIFDEKYSSRGSSRSSSTVRTTTGSANSGTANMASQPATKPEPEARGRNINVKNSSKDNPPNPLPLPAKGPSASSSPSPENKNVRSTSATRKSPPGSSVRKQVLQQNFSANKINDSNTSTNSSAPPTSSVSSTASSSSSKAETPVAANHGQQNENPNSNPKPPIAPKPSHNLKWWKHKK